MAHKFPSVLVHLFFSTRNRANSIPEDLVPRLWKYAAGIGANHGIPVLCAGGTTNHLHALFSLASDIPYAKAVQVLKANSSRWIGEHGVEFAWQEGYGAFSVSPKNVDAVRHYIEHQAEHHAKQTYEDEFVEMLRKSGLAFEPELAFD